MKLKALKSYSCEIPFVFQLFHLESPCVSVASPKVTEVHHGGHQTQV